MSCSVLWRATAIAVIVGTTIGSPGARQLRGQRPNVLLVVIDTTRANHVPGFGGTASNARWLASLTATRFTNAWSQAPTTTSAVASIFTGLYPFQHRVIDGRSGLDRSIPTLASVLSSAGYVTAHVTGNPNSGPLYGLSGGYRFVDYSRPGPDSLLLHQQLQHASAIESLARSFLEGERTPFFLSLHFNDPHSPYDPADVPSPPLPNGVRRVYDTPGSDPSVGTVSVRERADMLRRYDGEIANVDRALTRIEAFLRARHLWHRTVVVVTADHGEEFGDHGGWGHSHTLYPELLRVPLLVRVPSLAPRTVSAPVQHIDLLPTLLGLCDVQAPAGLPGSSRVPELYGRPGTRSEYRIAEKPDTARGPMLWSISDGRQLLIEQHTTGAEPQLYDLDTDPLARHDVSRFQPAAVMRLHNALTRASAATSNANRAEPRFDVDTLRNLQSLGYVQNGRAIAVAKDTSLAPLDVVRTILRQSYSSPLGWHALDSTSTIAVDESPRPWRIIVTMPPPAGLPPRPVNIRLRIVGGPRPSTLRHITFAAAAERRQVRIGAATVLRIPAGAIVKTDPVFFQRIPNGRWTVQFDTDSISLLLMTPASGAETTLQSITASGEIQHAQKQNRLSGTLGLLDIDVERPRAR